MIQTEKLDGIVICTPVGTHAEIMNYCYQNNLNMLVEKPLCRNLDELNFSIKGLEYKKMTIVTGYCLLFKDTFMKVKELLSMNLLGNIFSHDKDR